MKVDWQPLRRALADLRTANVALPLWWRDDDAMSQTPSLERLAEIGSALNVPLHLAVIPDLVEPSLPAMIADADGIIPMVHGWRHQRHLLRGRKDTEFGIRRADDTTETAQALARMRSLFEERLLPVFVPPWNMVADSLLPELAKQGYSGVSTFTPRKVRLAAPGLVQINTHLDPIDWRGTRGLIDPDQLVAHLVALLTARQNETDDTAEPLGFLTHHLVHTEDIWVFTRACLTELLDGGAVAVNLRDCGEALP